MSRPWHALDREEVLRQLASRVDGLSTAEAQARLLRYGLNALAAGGKPAALLVFLRQFLSPLIYVLMIAAAVSLAIGHITDAIVVLAVLLVNATIGFFQETRAERAMEALKEMAAPMAKVRRGGEVAEIPAREVVPADIVLLEAGDVVPADVRLLEAANLKANESALTGESMPSEKGISAVLEDAPVADRVCMSYMGTVIASGRAVGVVVETGMSTEMGKIAAGIQQVTSEKTPLQKNIGQLSRYLVFIFLSVTALLFIVGLVKRLDLLEMFLLAIAAAVAAIPEGLPAVLTVVLSIGMRAMARRNAIIRQLMAVETLGAADVICSDKTGTLTLNQMTVREIFVDGRLVEVTGEGYQPKGEFKAATRRPGEGKADHLRLLLQIGALCNDAQLAENAGQYQIVGDPTEGALVVAAAKAGMTKAEMEKSFPRLDEIPFESEKLYMATLHAVEEGRVAYFKGAPEKLLSLCRFQAGPEGIAPMGGEETLAVMAAAGAMARQALRVLAIACADLPPGTGKLDGHVVESGLTFVGLVGMADPPRSEAKQAVALCKQAGIRVVMITGDNKVTAEAIGAQLGLLAGRAVTGVEVEKMSDEALAKEIEGISIFARIEPLHKLKIVNALKRRGHIVAMTGDGVNDAPALKAANIGIAMGKAGTDVAKEASDMVLADDNFASVVAAVEEGRAIFARLRNVLFFSLNTNLSELVVLMLCILFIGVSPLLAVQILWINIVTDTAGDIPLGLEPKSGDELQRPPRRPGAGIMYAGLFLRIVTVAALIGIGSFLVFRWAESRMSLDAARTVTFCALAAFEWLMAFSARSDEKTVFKLGLLRNRPLAISIGAAALLQLAVVYVPFLQVAFHTAPIGLKEWGIVAVAAGGLFMAEELRKAFFPGLFSTGKY
ncbi:MAG: HAD-IC family P-type ATPase [Chloroflexi bacterium]|nr:HAD-IC family P-type ATPase [Chloroflexota bacterium]